MLSHYIHKRSIGTSTPKVTVGWIDNILENFSLPDPIDQSRNLILWVGTKFKEKPDVWISTDTFSLELTSISGARHGQGVNYTLCLLREQGYIDLRCEMAQEGPINIRGFRMTYKGWEYFSQLSKEAKDSKTAFIAMQFGNERNGGVNYIVERAVNECFRQAVLETGFQLRKVTDEQPTGLIDDHIIVGIRTAKFVIADLTDHNKGAYWEAGFAEGLGKSVIYTCHKDHFNLSHFDTNHRKTVIWHENNWEQAAKDLKDTIRVTVPDEAIMID